MRRPIRRPLPVARGLAPLVARGLALVLAPAMPHGASEPDVPAAVERAVGLLVSRQESLVGAEVPREWPYEGVYRVGGAIPIGYRVGGSSICAWALVETPAWERSAEVRAAVERGLGFVLESLSTEGMSRGFRGRYDVRGWGHTYALTFLLRLRATGRVPESRIGEVDDRITWLVETLEATAIPEVGGWAYSRRGGGAEPAPASPFMTAPTLLALYEAAGQGESVDPEVVRRALDGIEASRTTEGAIPYTTAGGRADMPGAIGRTPVCEVALLLGGRGGVDRIRSALMGFFEHWEWLEKRRQATGTHAPPYGVAPYYFFYAHYYAALAIELLPEAERAAARARLLARLFEVREDGGGWNDRVFARSESFGTAMGLLALRQPSMPLPPRWKEDAGAEGR